MFDESGRPQGYGQYSPFNDNPKPPGAVPEAKAVGGAGAGTPSTPVDPTLNGWRQGASQRQLGAPHMQHTESAGGPTPLGQAITGQQAPNPAAMGQIASDPNDPIAALYAKHGVQAGGDGSGFLDKKYWEKQSNATGGWFGASGSDPYWNDRLDADLSGTGPDGRPTPQRSPLLSAIIPGQPSPQSSLLDNTGTSNPLIAAIRQSLMTQKPQAY